ncbi:MAG: TspB protein [Inoviridae sp.]|nr:MAG: TspB protein [Inoviridae sp.]
MGLFNIFRVCSSLFLVAALGSAQANYIYDNRTGTWTPTARTVLAPPNASSPFNYIPRDSPPTVSSTGAFQNKTGGTFGSPPVNGISKNVPVTLNGTTTKPNVNKALLSRLGKGGLAGLALGVGVEALLNGIGGLIEEGGTVSRLNPPPVDPTAPHWAAITEPPAYGYSKAQACAAAVGKSFSGFSMPVISYSRPDPNNNVCHISGRRTTGEWLGPAAISVFGYNQNNPCPSGSSKIAGGYCDIKSPTIPIPPDVLEDAINAGYKPHPSDYPFLAPDPAMAPTIVEVEPIPRLDFPPVTTTTTDLNTGKTTTVTTNIWHDFNVKDNNSPQPKVEADTTEKSETYEDGVKTGESTTTSSSGTASGVAPVAGSGSGEKLEIDIPTDCDFMPTVCAFLEWYKDDDLGDDPDLASIMKDDEEFAKTKVISFGAAVCPQPYTIHISSLSMSVDLSFQFFCQFAEYARALVLAAAYIFAAYISLGVARG